MIVMKLRKYKKDIEELQEKTKDMPENRKYEIAKDIELLEEFYKKAFTLPDKSDTLVAIKLLLAVECDGLNYRLNREKIDRFIEWWKYW